MNLVEKLVKADCSKAYELKRRTFKSKRLAQLIGETEPVEITVREISQRKLNELMAMQYSTKGNFQIERTFDAKLMSIVEGVVEPSMTDKDLLNHFNASSPKELAEVLFGSEVTAISDAIMELSGVSEDNEDDLKN